MILIIFIKFCKLNFLKLNKNLTIKSNSLKIFFPLKLENNNANKKY